MTRKLGFVLLFLSLGCLAWAQTGKESTKATSGNELQQATAAIEHMSATAPDKGVPKDVLDGAKCVAVIPKLIKGAFIVGGEHGTGVATCRTSGNQWSAPAPFAVSGISWGPQIGGKSTDLLMFIMNDQGMQQLLSGHFKVGAGVSATAGPVGRSASGSAGWKSAILTYSSSKGAFIGASLNGAELQQDKKATEAWYGSDVPFQSILTGQAKMPNAEARAFVNAVANAKEVASAK